jgi:hypothetical protein
MVMLSHIPYFGIFQVCIFSLWLNIPVGIWQQVGGGRGDPPRRENICALTKRSERKLKELTWKITVRGMGIKRAWHKVQSTVLP